MCDNILIDAQKLKTRLSFVGQKDVDENVICELLKSFGPDYDLNFVTEMIMETNSMKDSYFKCNLVEAGSSNALHESCNTSESRTTNEKMDIEELNSNELCFDVYSSNSDGDDGYYVSCEPSPSKSPDSSPPLLASIEFCDATSTPIVDNDSACAVVDIEILEENNNDPNNNLDSIQSLQEQVNSSLESVDDVQKTEPDAECLSSPRPGCSKDFDDTEFGTSFDKKVQEEAVQICNLLPQLKYESVYAALQKNFKAENRVELSLWDLLPYKRPRVKLPSKRKFIDDSSFSESKKVSSKLSIDKCKETYFQDNLSTLLSNKQQNEKQINWVKQLNPVSVTKTSSCNKDIEIVSDNILPNDFFDTQTALNSSDPTNKEAQTDYENNKPSEHSIKFNKVLQSTKNEILHPAKLILGNSPPAMDQVASFNFPILSPSKLTYVTLQQQKLPKSREISTYKSRHENIESIKNNKSIPIKRNVFLPNSINLPISNNNTFKGQVLHNYMQYLNFMRNTKEQRLSGKFENFNFQTRNELRQIFLRSRFTNSNENISQFVNNTTSSKMLNIANINCDNNVTSNSNSKKTITVNSTNPSLYNASSDAGIIDLQNPSENSLTIITSGSSDVKLPNIATAEIAAETVNLQKVPQTALISITSENSGITLPDNATVKTTIAVTSDSDTLLCQSESNYTTTNLIVSSTQTPLSSTVTSSNVVSSKTVSTTTAASSFNECSAIPSITSILRSAKSHSSIQSINTMRSDNSIAIISNEPSTSTAVHSVPDTKQVFKGITEKSIRNKMVDLCPKFKKLNKELSVLPQTDKEHMKREFLKYCNTEKDDPFIQLQKSSELLIHQNEELCPVKKDTKQACQEQTNIEDEQYAYLSDIFPDADSEYLKKVVARKKGDHDAIIDFIQSQCLSPTYPTKEETLRRIRITEQQKQYIYRFDVKKFLEIFPDPFKHFEDSERKCKYNPDALDFIYSYFTLFETCTLNTFYESSSYNLSILVKNLENVIPERQSERITCSWKPPEDIPLLQECAFIIYKVQVREYLNKLREDETELFKKLKNKNELLECQCCYDNECMPSKCSTCDDGHIFCNSCIIKGTVLKLAQGDTRISCFEDCDGEFSLLTLQKLLPPTQFSILINKIQEAEVMAAGLEGLVSCPFCHFASIPPPEDKVFKCLNPECMKESCRFCKKLSHIPLRCNEDEIKARLFLEEKMTEALVRKCYKCGRPYFKEDGCNKISCSCGAWMCYICDKPIIGYDHFNINLCPLWSDNDLINTGTVQAVAKKTMEYITEKHPTIKIDAPDLLQRHSVDSNALSERVNKIAKFDT